MAYGDFKDLNRRTFADKILRDKGFNIAKEPKYGSGIKNDNITNKELAKELRKPIIIKFKKRKVHSLFLDNNWGTDLADMQLIKKLIKDLDFCYVLLIFIVNMHELSL